jgi:hypothetical protein
LDPSGALDAVMGSESRREDATAETPPFPSTTAARGSRGCFAIASEVSGGAASAAAFAGSGAAAKSSFPDGIEALPKPGRSPSDSRFATPASGAGLLKKLAMLAPPGFEGVGFFADMLKTRATERAARPNCVWPGRGRLGDCRGPRERGCGF